MSVRCLQGTPLSINRCGIGPRDVLIGIGIRCKVVLCPTVYLLLIGTPANGLTQTIPDTFPAQQPTVTISPIQPFSAPTSGIPANILTPSTTNRLEPNFGLRSAGAGALNSIGRGVPGMSGGPPLNSPMGARDPSAQYMRPPTIGPLFCDPALNIPC
jgi:hypothetical protein